MQQFFASHLSNQNWMSQSTWWASNEDSYYMEKLVINWERSVEATFRHRVALILMSFMGLNGNENVFFAPKICYRERGKATAKGNKVLGE